MLQIRRDILHALQGNGHAMTTHELCVALNRRVTGPTLRGMYHDALLDCIEGRPERWSLSRAGRAVLGELNEREKLGGSSDASN